MEQVRNCSGCGHVLDADARFCPGCGQVVGAPLAAPAPPPAGPPPGVTAAVPVTAAVVSPGVPPPVRRRGPSTGLVVGLVLAVLALIGGLVVVLVNGGGDDDASDTTAERRTTVSATTDAGDTTAATSAPDSTTVGDPAGEVILQPLGTPPPDPFTDSVVSHQEAEVTVALPDLGLPTAPETDSGTALLGVAGNRPGLYGGTRDRTECDVEGLVSYLEQHPDKAAAWAGVQGIQPSEIRDFASRLTPVVLTRDTRVTNHGFKDGKARPHQSILRAGTAVLVDEFGVPRAQCSCGNPLAPPVPTKQPPTYTDPWPGFDPTTVVVVQPVAVITVIILIDVTTGVPFNRPIGVTGPDTDLAVDEQCQLFPDDPACTSGQDPEGAPILFDNGNIGGVQNGPESYPIIETVEPTIITFISTYHWNDGQGAPAGQIWIQSLVDNTVYGPWSATGRDGQGGVPSAYWVVTPGVEIPAGTFYVLDSDPATWAWNAESAGVGFAVVRGYPADGTVDEEHTGDWAIAILDSELRSCGYMNVNYQDNGPSDQGRSIIAQNPFGPAEFIVVGPGNIQVNDQTAADVAVQCGFYQP